jgi:sugar lactone lactonase YvrE
VGQGYQFTEGTASNSLGEVFYQDIPNSKTYRVSTEGKLSVLPIDAKKASGTSFGSDGKRYVVTHGVNQVISYDVNGKENIVTEKIEGNDLVIAKNGNMYITVPDGIQNPSKIYLIKPNGEKKVVDEGLKFANGIALTPDQTQLYVAESASHWVWIYKIEEDGTLTQKQRFGWLHSSDDADNAWGDGIKCDRDGRVYVATRLGIQVLDQLGRVNAILPSPAGQVSNSCFGGPNFDVLYISCGDKVYRRKLKVHGANSFDAPAKPAKPRL